MCISKRAVSMSLTGLTTSHAYVLEMIDMVTEGHLVEVIDHEGNLVFTALPAVRDAPAQQPQTSTGEVA